MLRAGVEDVAAQAATNMALRKRAVATHTNSRRGLPLHTENTVLPGKCVATPQTRKAGATECAAKSGCATKRRQSRGFGSRTPKGRSNPNASGAPLRLDGLAAAAYHARTDKKR